MFSREEEQAQFWPFLVDVFRQATAGTKAAQQVSFPYAFRIAARLAVVVMDDPVTVSGAAIQMRPLPLACVVLIGLGPLASIPLTLMAV